MTFGCINNWKVCSFSLEGASNCLRLGHAWVRITCIRQLCKAGYARQYLKHSLHFAYKCNNHAKNDQKVVKLMVELKAIHTKCFLVLGSYHIHKLEVFHVETVEF